MAITKNDYTVDGATMDAYVEISPFDCRGVRDGGNIKTWAVKYTYNLYTSTDKTSYVGPKNRKGFFVSSSEPNLPTDCYLHLLTDVKFSGWSSDNA